MITTIEYWSDGSTLKSKLEDNGDGTGTFTTYDQAGLLINTTPMIGLPPASYGPLDPAGSLATLLVVEGILPLTDAANAVREEEARLQHEALAWSLWV
jgi:hypothetical protein